MSDLVRREDVLRVATEAFDALEKRVAKSRHAGDGHMEEKWLARLDEVGGLRKKLRALPAIGTCATCAEWLEEPPFYGGLGHCKRWDNHFKPDHFCAGYKPKKEVEQR